MGDSLTSPAKLCRNSTEGGGGCQDRGGVSVSLQHHFGLTNTSGVSDITPIAMVRETFSSKGCRLFIEFMGKSTLRFWLFRLNYSNFKKYKHVGIYTNHPSLIPTGTKQMQISAFPTDPPKWAGIKTLSPPSHKASSHLLTTSPHRCVMFSLCQQFCPPTDTLEQNLKGSTVLWMFSDK